jgi:orotidine-5'-phosphate decarboxylase
MFTTNETDVGITGIAVRPKTDEIKFPLAVGKIIVDLSSIKPAEMKEFVKNIVLSEAIFPYIMCFRVGLNFMMIYSPTINIISHNITNEEESISNGGKIFLDTKFFTDGLEMKEAIKNITMQGVKYFSVHASSGTKMMKTAKETADEEFEKYLIRFGKISDDDKKRYIDKRKPVVLAETIPMFMQNGDLMRVYKSSRTDLFKNFVAMAKEAGMDGIICAEEDLASYHSRKIPPDKLIKVVLTTFSNINSAIKKGATAVILGGEITNPLKGTVLEALEKAAKEIDDFLKPKEKHYRIAGQN